MNTQNTIRSKFKQGKVILHIKHNTGIGNYIYLFIYLNC